MSELDLEQLQSLRRLEACQKRLARYVREGRDYVVVIAHENTFVGNTPVENPGFVQFAWRDDLRLQIEVQGDHYRDEPYSALQQRRLTRLGYAPPFEHGDDFCNWTLFREAEGCQPESVTMLLIESMRMVFGTHFLDIPRVCVPGCHTGNWSGWCRQTNGISKPNFERASARTS